MTKAAPTKDSPAEAASSPGASSSSPDNSSESVSNLLDTEFAKGLLEELGDQSKLGQRGELWTIAQFVTLALVLVPPFHSTALTTLLGVALLLGGGAAIGFALPNLGTSLTPLPEPRKDSKLVQTGPYQYMRHPMYGGSLMLALGLAAVTHDESRLLWAAVLWLVLEQKVAFEESLLVDRYGAAYQEYQKSVKKFFPYLY